MTVTDKGWSIADKPNNRMHPTRVARGCGGPLA
jgi:hypothetical protein